MNALICVKREFEFDSPRVLLNTMDQLRFIIEKNEEHDADVPETTRRPLINEPTLREANNACDKACYRSMVVSSRKIQDKRKEE